MPAVSLVTLEFFFCTWLTVLSLGGLTAALANGCTRQYTVKEGDICDSISAANNVSTYVSHTLFSFFHFTRKIFLLGSSAAPRSPFGTSLHIMIYDSLVSSIISLDLFN